MSAGLGEATATNQVQVKSFTAASRTEGEDDEGALSSSSRPRRKRSRRRRKKTGGGGSESPDRQGALSDGAYDLVRAQSSSNVSRTSTLENEILHFEDENEFPNLLSAVGGLQADNAGGTNISSISYCDILKGHVVSYCVFICRANRKIVL